MNSIGTSTIISERRKRNPLYYSIGKLLTDAGQEQFLHQALYTTTAIMLCIVFCSVAIYAYLVLYLFVKPLLWAVFCGLFLFPFKYALHNGIQVWLMEILEKDGTLTVSMCLLPFSLFDRFSEWLGELLLSKWKILIGLTAGLVLIYFLQYFGFLVWSLKVTSELCKSLWFFVYVVGIHVRNNNIVILTILTLYFFTIYFYQSRMLYFASFAMWPLLLLHLMSWVGTWHIPLVSLVLLLLALGFLPDSKVFQSKYDMTRSSITSASHKGDSYIYFHTLFATFAVVVVWMHIWLLFLMFIPFSYWLCKKLLLHNKTFGLLNAFCLRFLSRRLEVILFSLSEQFSNYASLVIPTPIYSLLYVMQKGDRKIHLGILSSLPTVTSTLIILIIFTSGIFVALFLTIKIQQESFLLVHVTSNMINETVYQHPEYLKWLPGDEDTQKKMDSFVNTLYLQGREWISQKVHERVGEHVNVTKIEKQALKIWDRIYKGWFLREQAFESLPTQKSAFENFSDKTRFDGMLKLLNVGEIVTWLQDNISALSTFAESLLSLIKSNMALIMSILTAVFTTLLIGGTLVFNFLLSMIIFFSTLFYLLASSSEQYKPLEIIGSAIRPFTVEEEVENAIEDAVNRVFGVSLKMLGYYGLYTWVNHYMFGSNLVYIPSVLAGLLGVMRLLATYLVCIPSALEIWLLQGSLVRAVGLVICQLLPTFFVDAAIYKDISISSDGTHPYIIGLAIAGGVYTFGLEGAVTGPLILCVLFAVVNLYTSAASSSVSS